ncbi:hypothetical protein [Halomonas stenophila]|uniref:Uncharacterized protein n=1 Tax=Halomonas stenophila TaxID=795312 RepID=A0A7W5ESQ4_9GAMM|nr:hypothetical protein [Halomonas stenophila]
MIGLIYAQTGLFSPRASEAERELWQAQDEAIASHDALGAAAEATTTDASGRRAQPIG